MQESYHFKTPEDIAHLLAKACIITVCDCREGYWHQQLDEASSFLNKKQSEVDFFGETYTSSGHKPVRSKVSAITAMPSPTNKKQVQSFIGIINYLSTFLPRLSELAELIGELSKDKIPFNWGPEHQAAFQQMKTELSCVPMLGYYNT